MCLYVKGSRSMTDDAPYVCRRYRKETALTRMVLAVFLMFGFCHATAAMPSESVRISLSHDSATERETEDQLRRILNQYDLSGWIYTTEIMIDDNAIPHSDPILTLHTRHLKDDDLLLSTFIHEQMHRFLALQPKRGVDQAKADLRKLYPSIPVGYPEGSTTDDGNYEHLLVIWLEYRADVDLLGELRARQVMEFWAADHYTWIYQKMLERQVRSKILAVIKADDLRLPD